MQKVRFVSQYEDTVNNNLHFFLSYYYHAILDLNLIKASSIIENGIYSRRFIELKHFPSLYTHLKSDYDCKNGNDYISVSKYLINNPHSIAFSSFFLHTLTSISFLIEKNVPTRTKGYRETNFSDELFVAHRILKKNIAGILLPEHLGKSKIKEVICLSDDLSNYNVTYINHWISCIEAYFHVSLSAEDKSRIFKSLENLLKILDKYDEPENMLNYLLIEQKRMEGIDLRDILSEIVNRLWEERLNIEEPTYLDALLTINHDEFPIYEITPKSLIRKN